MVVVLPLLLLLLADGSNCKRAFRSIVSDAVARCAHRVAMTTGGGC